MSKIERTRITFEVDIDYDEYHSLKENIFNIIDKKIDEISFANNTETFIVDVRCEDDDDSYPSNTECEEDLRESCDIIEEFCSKCKNIKCVLSGESSFIIDPNQTKLTNS